jgi:transcriptional regulator with XRE-family HTH domain
VAKSSGLINEKEREIVRRVRKVRYSNQLSQSAFARALGVGRDRVASLECARTPLNVELADKIAATFDVGLGWLANGVGAMKPSIGTIVQNWPQINGRSLFSKAFTTDVEQRLLARDKFHFFSMVAILTDRGNFPQGKEAEKYLEMVQHRLEALFYSLPHDGKEKLLVFIVHALSQFDLDWALGRRELPGRPDDEKKNQLAKINASVNIEKMKARMPDFQNRLKKLTAKRGEKTKLANFLGVPLAAVSQWVSGKRKPNGENALMLLHWVEVQERQK